MQVIAPPPKPISTGIEELDVKLGGGIPYPAFALIEGDHGSGKTAISFLVASTLLKAGYRVLFISTESATREVINKAVNIGFSEIKRGFLYGRAMVYSVHLAGSKWDEVLGRRALKILARFFSSMEKRYDAMTIDSASILFSYASRDTIYDFISLMRSAVNRGRFVMITMHRGALPEDISIRLRATSDIYLHTGLVEFSGRVYKSISVKKIHGSETAAEHSIVFDVDPAIGIRILPISLSAI